MMCVRLIELTRVLKHTGSIYLHCDPTASHYLKMLMDTIFSPANFRNELIWRRTGAHGAQRSYGPIHDTILFYSKADDYYFRVIKQPYMKGHVERRYSKDESGEYKFTSGGNVLTGAGATKGESGKPWKGIDPTVKNRHWAIPGFLTEQMPMGFEKLGTLEKLDQLYAKGLIEIKEGTQWPTPVRYLLEDSGNQIQDIWAYQPYTEGTVYGSNEGIDKDVAWLGTTDPERMGYQTQKPLGLLERIIMSSCPDEGIVLDPFCGCGTAVVAAQNLKRKWIGIDITHLAIGLMKWRLKNLTPPAQFIVVGEPKDLTGAEELARQDKYQFQWWAVAEVGGQPYGERKKGSDTGIDGYLYYMDEKDKIKKAIISVKGGHNANVSMIRDLGHVIDREKADIGVFISIDDPTRPMQEEAAMKGFYHSPLGRDYPRIQILTIAQILEGKRPDIPPWIAPIPKSIAPKSNDSGKPKLL
jgi:site-specific DNA-methyltransferase (adenine-specific)